MNNLEIIRELIINDQIDDAIDLILNIESEYLDSDVYWLLRGMACFKINQLKLSEEAFKIALEINKENVDANYNLAFLYNELGCYSEASLYFGLTYRYTDELELKNELDNIYSNDPCKLIFDTAKQKNKNTFIILSNIIWSEVQQRVHHIAKSLSKLGHTVHFIDPRVEIEMQDLPQMRELILASSLEPTYKKDTLQVYKPLVVRNSETGELILDSYTELIDELNISYNNSNKESTIIAYHPDCIDDIVNLKTKYTLIYDCVDDHSDSDIAFWGGKDCILKEHNLMNKADFITTTSTSLFIERAILQNRNNVFLSKNAVNEIDFTMDEPFEPEDLKNIPHPRIIYAGFVYDRFDEQLFYEAVKSNPDKSFIVIGPVNKGFLETDFDNLYKLGVKNHSELKYYLNNCDIGFVPHIENCDMDIACDSIKQYEFLASGLEVITTFVPESVLDKIKIHPISNIDEFNKSLKERLTSEKYINDDLALFLANNSWNNRASLLCSLANREFGEEEFNSQLEFTRNTLNDSAQIHSKPIIHALNEVTKDIDLNEKVNNLERIYNLSKEKFIEKLYIKLLIQNNELHKISNIISSSENVNDELKQHLSSLNKTHNEIEFKITASISIYDLATANNLVKLLEDNVLKEMYKTYIQIITGSKLSSESLNLIKNSNNKSPLVNFIKKELSRTNIHNTIVIGDDSAGSKTMLDELDKNILISEYYSLSQLKNVSIKDTIYSRLLKDDSNIVILGDSNYVEIVKELISNNVQTCSLAIRINKKISIEKIPTHVINGVKNKVYKQNVLLIHAGLKDSNLHAIADLIPNEFKNKYRPILIPTESLEDKVGSAFLPLLADITVSGHGPAYWKLPNYTHHIEVWHAGLSLKTCALMDKQDKGSGIGNIKHFKRAHSFCVASHMDMMIKNSWFALSEDKYKIIGQPRTDLLFRTNGRENLSKILKKDLNDTKIVLNMPTFHSFDSSGRIEGAEDMNESIKIRDFDYYEFNLFLKENNIVFISKVHPREEDVVSKNMEKYKGTLSNIVFLTNDDLEDHNMQIYEILNGADVLVTDYSSVYSDYLLLDRPIVFVNTDLDEYRNARGISLEPYDFWTAGPKVQTQDQFQKELKICTEDKTYYQAKRQELMPIFHAYTDDNATYRFWELVDNIKNGN